jgi:fructosamine-3-kinase
MFIREAECLKELAKADSELIIPKVYGAKTIDTSPGFLILEYLEPGNSSVNADEKLGRGLAQLHTFEHNRFGFHEIIIAVQASKIINGIQTGANFLPSIV